MRKDGFHVFKNVRTHSVRPLADRTGAYRLRQTSELVLLHGFAGAPDAWRRTTEHLLTEAKTRTPSLPYHGPSPYAAGGWNEAARHLAEPLRRRGSAGWWIGYSMGARMAMAVATHCPETVRGLVLIGGHPGLTTQEDRDARRDWEQSWVDRLRQRGLANFFAEWARMPLFESQRALPAATREEQMRCRLRHDPDELARAFETFALSGMPDYRPTLRALDRPVYLLAGESDEKYCALGEATASLAPHVTFRTIPGAGHNPVLENPEALAREIAWMVGHPEP